MIAKTMAAALSLAAAAQSAAQSAPAAPPAAQADHIALDVADENASAEFYKAAFGLRDLPTPLENRRWLDLGNGVALHLLGDRVRPLVITKSVHLALRVPSLEPLIAYLKSRNMGWEDWSGSPGKVTLRPDDVRQIYVRDLDGYWIEVNDAGGR